MIPKKPDLSGSDEMTCYVFIIFLLAYWQFANTPSATLNPELQGF